MHHVSPELALVDPDLAARLRAALPDPPDCLAPRLPFVPRPRVAVRPRPVPMVSFPPPLAELAPAPRRVVASPLPTWEPPSRARRRFERALTTALWAPLAAVVGSSLLAFISTGSSQPRLEEPARLAPRSSPRGGSAESDPKGPVAGADPVARPPKPSRLVLRWQPVADADFYDVVVVAKGKRRDYWPARNQLALRRGGSAGAGPIRWYVYPAYRVDGVVQFGKLHAQGSGTAVVP